MIYTYYDMIHSRSDISIYISLSLYIYIDVRYISTGVNMWNGCDMCGYDLRFCQEEVRNGRAYEAFIVPPTYGKFFRRKMVINPIFFQTDPGCEMPIGEAKRRMYHLVMTNSSPWKDPPIFKFGKASISIRAIYFPWQTVNVITRLGNHNIKDGFRAIQ